MFSDETVPMIESNADVSESSGPARTWIRAETDGIRTSGEYRVRELSGARDSS